jgi:hypothetical protein
VTDCRTCAQVRSLCCPLGPYGGFDQLDLRLNASSVARIHALMLVSR